ncbi:MAG TPA: fibronectin type III-like domain-contianing protein [Puia sp.]|nr:fibronectin type III-like domain-contianing protein [Puia sp.]
MQTVQIYVAMAGSAIERAAKELKGFKKVFVRAGGSVDVTIDLPIDDLAYYDTNAGKWKIEPGMYAILAGTSSRDINAGRGINVVAD